MCVLVCVLCLRTGAPSGGRGIELPRRLADHLMTSNAISSLLLQCYNVASASRLICLLLLMTDKHAEATMSSLSRQVLLAVTLFAILHAVALLH